MPGADSARARRSQAGLTDPGRKNPRLRLACLRCQRRKIRCDGDLPSCKNCRNAGADCADGESARLKDLPRAYIVNLKGRIAWLESIVRSRCPEIDLSQPQGSADLTLDDQPSMLDSSDIVETSLATPVTAEDSLVAHHDASASQPQDSTSRPVMGGGSALSHEIGLVSLGTNQDPRYIGPSSGYFLARVMLTKPTGSGAAHREMNAPAFPSELVEAVQGPLPIPSRDMARQLCVAYFDFIHPQYPVLHQPTFMMMLDQALDQQGDSLDQVVGFQVYMVLAIGATVLSGRLKARLPGESYCLSAMQYFPNLNVKNSMQGLQCLVLLFIFTIHNPYMRLNVWYLNYQCIAGLLDIGLQRDINTNSGITLLEQEMRTRIFWVVMMLDRIIATMMGRPIGLRDEACELRLPQGLDDFALHNMTPASSDATPIRYSVHLFRLTKLNSEIKYVANSIVQDASRYAYPPIANIHDWQADTLRRLDDWAAQIPVLGSDAPFLHMNLICSLRYHSLRMLLLRPSPAIPKPSPDVLTKCHLSAKESIRIFDHLYKKNMLVHSWLTFHSLVLSTLTMLYCIKVVPEIAQGTQVDVLMGDLSVGLSILSATGEHWSGAKRSRDILDELGRSTIRWLLESQGSSRGFETRQTHHATRGSSNMQRAPPIDPAMSALAEDSAATLAGETGPFTFAPFDDVFADGSFANYFEPTDPSNVDDIFRDLFQDFIPTYSQFT